MDAGRWFRVRCGKAWRSAGGGKTVSCPAAGGLGSEAAQSPPPPPACCPGRAATAGGGLLDRCSRSRFLAFAGLNGKQVRAPGHAFACVRAAKPALPPQRSADYQAPIARAPPWRAAVTAFLRPENGFSERAGRLGLGCKCGAPCAARSSPQARIPACFKPFRRRLRACGRPARAFSFPVSVVRPGLRAASRFGLARTAAFLAWRVCQGSLVRAFFLARAAFRNAVCGMQTHKEKKPCSTHMLGRRLAHCWLRWLLFWRLRQRTPRPGR